MKSLLRAVLILSALTAACSERPSTPLAPERDLVAPLSISGHVLAPNNASICTQVSGAMTVRLYRRDGNTTMTGTPQTLVCPNNTFNYPNLLPDTYWVRVTFNPPYAVGNLPIATMDFAQLFLTTASIQHDLMVTPGYPLLGNAYLDGVQIDSVNANVYVGIPISQINTTITSTPAGWREFTGRQPPVIQYGPFRYFPCRALGAMQPPNNGVFLSFSTPPVNCNMTTSRIAAYTHDHTQLIATIAGGDFGYTQVATTTAWGTGYGVQYPATTPRHAPETASQLAGGGLILSANGHILHGFVGAPGYLQCIGCTDFTAFEGSIWKAPEGKVIKWQFHDQGPDAVGISARQYTYDGRFGDYVLAHFIIENQNNTPLTLDGAGVFMDWDVGDAPGANVAHTTQNGSVMYVMKPEGGVRLGTLLAGTDGTLHNYIRANSDVPLTDQLAALNGTLTVTDNVTPADQWYFHTAGPAVIAKKGSYDFWVALIGGRTEAEFTANADAAAKDIHTRLHRPDEPGIPPEVIQKVIDRSDGHVCKAKPFADECPD